MKNHNLRALIYVTITVALLCIIVGFFLISKNADKQTETTTPPLWNGWEVKCNTGCTAKLHTPPQGVSEVTIIIAKAGELSAAKIYIATAEITASSDGLPKLNGAEIITVRISPDSTTFGEKHFYKFNGEIADEVDPDSIKTEPLELVKTELSKLSSHPSYGWLKSLLQQ